MKFIDDMRGAWRHYSTKALAVIVGLGGAWANLPDSIRSALPSWAASAVAWIVFAVAALGLAGKFVDQTPKDPK